MDKEKFRNDPKRLELLQKLIDLHDNAVISHKLDDNQNIVAAYDKYSTIQINKARYELSQYERHTYGIRDGVFPGFIEINGRTYHNEILQPKALYNTDETDLKELNKSLKEALENENYEECERLKNLIKKLSK